jgi:hypothetical protein
VPQVQTHRACFSLGTVHVWFTVLDDRCMNTVLMNLTRCDTSWTRRGPPGNTCWLVSFRTWLCNLASLLELYNQQRDGERARGMLCCATRAVVRLRATFHLHVASQTSADRWPLAQCHVRLTRITPRQSGVAAAKRPLLSRPISHHHTSASAFCILCCCCFCHGMFVRPAVSRSVLSNYMSLL